MLNVKLTIEEAVVIIEALHEYVGALISLDLEVQPEVEAVAQKINYQFQLHNDAIRASADFAKKQAKLP